MFMVPLYIDRGTGPVAAEEALAGYSRSGKRRDAVLPQPHPPVHPGHEPVQPKTSAQQSPKTTAAGTRKAGAATSSRRTVNTARPPKRSADMPTASLDPQLLHEPL